MSEIVKAQSKTDASDRVIPIDIIHDRIHTGSMYRVNGEFTLGSGATQYMLFRTSSKTCHIYGEVSSSDIGTFKFYESPTITADGNSITILNKNRNYDASAATATIFSGPTVSDPGTLLDPFIISSTKKAGGSERNENEWNLKPNTDYLFVIYSGAASNNIIAKADWYEI